MNGNKIPVIAVVCTLIIAAAVVLSFVFLKNDPEFEEPSGIIDVTLSELKVISSTENDGSVDVETTYGKFSYPSAFADIMSVKAVSEEKTTALQFFSNIDGKEALIYTIYYNNDIGTPCGLYTFSESGEEIVVSVVFENLPENISSDWISTFRATQETFNDVIESMDEDERFVMAR